MSGWGIIAGALGGAGQSIAEQTGKDIDEEHKAHLAQLTSDMDLAKLKSAADYKLTLENQARNDLRDRRTATMGGIVDGRLETKYGGPDARPMTDAQSDPGNGRQAALDASRAAERATAMSDERTMVQADRMNGDLDPKDLAARDTRLTNAEARVEMFSKGLDARERMNDANIDGRDRVAQMRVDAYKARASSLNPEDKAVHNEVVSNNVQVHALSVTNDKIAADMIALSKDGKAAAQAKIDANQKLIDSYRKKNDDLFKGAKDARAVRGAVTAAQPLIEEGTIAPSAPTERPANAAGHETVPPQVQEGRDSESITILQREIDKYLKGEVPGAKPGDREAVERELARVRAKAKPGTAPVAAAPAASAAAKAPAAPASAAWAPPKGWNVTVR